MKYKELFNLPNMLSLSRIFFGFIFLGLFLTIQSNGDDLTRNIILQIVAFLVFIIAIITDALDGYYARKLNIVTDIGKHLDPLTDCIFFIIVFFTFTVIGLMHPILFLIILIREIGMNVGLRPFVKRKGKSLPASIYGKLKTIFQCVLSLLILFLLIVTNFMSIVGLDTALINSVTGITALFSFIFIVFLSVMSMSIYLINLKKIIA